LALFALHHSIMASAQSKDWLLHRVPQAAERSTYVLASSLCMILLFWRWQPMTGVVWRVEHSVASAVLLGLLLGGLLLAFVATCLLDHFELFCLRQVYERLRGRETRPASFSSPGLYR
jgi:protein-S-isoprenylcysteine O-methyltransferase Ste14